MDRTAADARAARDAVIARELSRLPRPVDLSARCAYLRARDELAVLLRVGAAADVVEAHRYRAQRALEVLTAALHPQPV